MGHINALILEFYLSSVVFGVYVLAPAYTNLWRGLEYLLKVRYIIVVEHFQDGFLIFETVFLGKSATLLYVKKRAFVFGKT